MAIVVVFDIPGATQAQYDAAIAALVGPGKSFNVPSDLPVPGLISHVAGPIAGGWHVTDVWESQAAFNAFTAVLMPILAGVGIPAVPPKVFAAHKYVH